MLNSCQLAAKLPARGVGRICSRATRLPAPAFRKGVAQAVADCQRHTALCWSLTHLILSTCPWPGGGGGGAQAGCGRSSGRNTQRNDAMKSFRLRMLPSCLWQTATVAGRKLVWPLIGCGTQWLVHSEDAGDRQPGAETRGCQVPRVPASLMLSTDCPTVASDRQVQCASHCQGGLRKPLPDNGRHASQASCSSGNRFSHSTSWSLPLPPEAIKALLVCATGVPMRRSRPLVRHAVALDAGHPAGRRELPGRAQVLHSLARVQRLFP